MRVGELVDASGVPATTLRYYDAIGLLVPRRLPNGHRVYGEDALERLRLIRFCQALGLPLDEIATLLLPGAAGRRREIARRRLRDVDRQLQELTAVRAALQHLAVCRHGPREGRRCAELVTGAVRAAAGPLPTAAPLGRPAPRRTA